MLIYYLVPGKLRNLLLFLGSLIFYAWGEPVYVILMLFSSIFNYYMGTELERLYYDDRKQKINLIFSIIINLAVLVFFKYYGFLLNTIGGIIGIHIPHPELSLPIGLSFYTFRNLSYLFDIYLSKVSAHRNFLTFSVYSTMFPYTSAGPIVRYTDIETQLKQRTINISKFGIGAELFVKGLAKKVLLADNLSVLYSSICGHPQMSVFTSWLGILAYTMQLYFDFSGYSDMAIGLGKIFGFHFLENFDYPYISKSVTEFWRRWHISLSTWFRDYIYIPLGGSYCSKKRQAFNMFVVWACTGMWHGAAWNFVVWGMWFYILLVGEKYLWGKGLGKMPSVFQHIYALLAAVISWVFFRAPDLPYAFDYLKAMFSFGGTLTDSQAVYYLLQYAPELILCVIASIPVKKYAENALRRRAGLDCGPDSAAGGEERLGRNAAAFLLTWGPKILALCLLMLSYTELVTGSFNPFIYFRF